MDSSSRQTTPREARIGLALLMVIALFNYIDRSIIAVLQVPLKRDLGLSDTQLGALTGLSFALFYTTMALPIAWLADRVNRTRLIAAALTIWSAMTALSGLAGSFVTLLLLRIGVAFGEAGCIPASHALISDYFPPHRRASIISIWGMALPVGMMLGFQLGGVLNEMVGWRGAFAVVGLSGIVFAPVVLWLMTEPRRGQQEHLHARSMEAPPSVGVALRTLWQLKSFRYMLIAQALQAFAFHATINWNAPFYVRVHGMPIAEVATWLGLLSGLGGGLGIFLGGMIADRLAKRDRRWYCGVPAVASALLFPAMLTQYLLADARASLLFAFLPSILVQIYLAPGVATAQNLVPPQMRAFTSATMVMVVNILGMGLGPLVIGVMSDAFTAHTTLGDTGLRYAICASLVVCIPASVFFFLSARHLERELPDLHAKPVPA